MFSVFRVGFVSIWTFPEKDTSYRRSVSTDRFFRWLVLELIPKNVFGVTSHSMLLSIKSK